MGANNNCCAMRDGDRDSDLSSPSLRNTNDYQKFERSFPFARTYVDTFIKRVKGASYLTKRGDPSSDGSYVTLQSLRETFLTEAWDEIRNEDSRLCKLLNSTVFKHETKEHIDINSLVLFGIHHCAGGVEDKSTAMYGVFQEGGEA